MSVIDELERLGAMAERGEITVADAAQRLRQYNDGRMTQAGAEDMIGDWRSVRAAIEATAAQAASGLASCRELP